MLKLQSILLSLILATFSLITLSAEEQSDAAAVDSASDKAAQTAVNDDNLMIRQVQPIKGFQPLIVAGQEIGATFLEETLGESHGAIVLLHDLGEDLESSGVITPLRHQLLQYGWSTLSVKLDYPYTAKILLATDPGSETDASTAIESTSAPEDEATAETSPSTDTELAKTDDNKNEDVAPLLPVSNRQRIEAAIEFLKAKGIKRLIFLGHGQGGSVAIDELAVITTPISALILVGAPALENYDEFKKYNLPILDIYGDQDLQGVEAAVDVRKVLMKRNSNIGYTEREIIGANHVFYGLEPLLTSTIRGWLYTTFVKQEESDE